MNNKFFSIFRVLYCKQPGLSAVDWLLYVAVIVGRWSS